ncbi:MAG: apolipoprotein N-acyltransferase [Planctomycetota bacterium]|nr:MAG: apolipoprotein N-acyltransferase [Planctomycetota bacterium]
MATHTSAPELATETKIVSDASGPASNPRTARRSEPSVKEIIAAARSQPAPALGGLILSGVSAVLLFASFTPLDWSPLAWLAIAPLCVLIQLERAPKRLWLTTWAGGLLFWLPTLQWLRLGHESMYVAWFALAFYLSAYWWAFVGLSRAAVHRCGLPMVVAVPLVWTGLEFCRAHLMTGFAWYQLGHSQYRWIELIQISDLLGAYGVSAVVAMSNAVLAGLVPQSWLSRLRLIAPIQLPSELRHLSPPTVADETSAADSRGLFRRQLVSVAAGLLVMAAVLGYGYVRRGQAEFTAGPRVALIQGNFESSVKHDPAEFGQMYRTHELLTGYAVPYKPDLIIWPETMFRWPLSDADPNLSENDLRRLAPMIPVEHWRDSYVRKALHEMSQKTGANLVIGLDRFSVNEQGLKHFNSAAFVTPDRGVADTYDKLHRVIFGEYVPLKESLPWLKVFSPLPDDFGISAGSSSAAFRCGSWQVAPIICFEDTVPHLVRDVVRGTSTEKRLDCLLNLTNDGWFHGSSELNQHLITAAFRAVECRTPLVRAVNTGISAVIDGDGVIREPETLIDGDATWNKQREQLQQTKHERSDRRVPLSMFDPVRSTLTDPATGRWRKSMNAAVIDTVPLDSRRSWYVASGDWFAGTCSAACGLFFVVGLIPRRRAA